MKCYFRSILAALLLFFAGCCDTSSYRVVAFTASWCRQCREDKPELKRLDRLGYQVSEIDADQHQDRVERDGVKILPTYFVYRDNRLEGRTSDIGQVIRLLRE